MSLKNAENSWSKNTGGSPVVCVWLFSDPRIYRQQLKLAKRKKTKSWQQFLSPHRFCVSIKKRFCVGTRAAFTLKNTSQLSVFSSFPLTLPSRLYRANKAATPSNICLLIIHSAGTQMAPGSSGLAPGIINQLVHQLWVNAGALKFNSLLYEVCCSLQYLNEASLSL